MPIYEYQCASCGFQFEEVQKFNDKPIEECPNCGQKSANRLVSMSAFHLKGGGWYKDGYSVKDTESQTNEKPKNDKAEKSINQSSAKDKSSITEKLGNTNKKDPTYSKKSESSGKEKAA